MSNNNLISLFPVLTLNQMLNNTRRSWKHFHVVNEPLFCLDDAFHIHIPFYLVVLKGEGYDSKVIYSSCA